MTRFRFRLDRVLQLKQRAERDQARALGAALREEERRRAEQREAEALAARAAEQLAKVGEQPLPAGALANLGLARDVADLGADAARERVEEAGQRVSEERGLYDEKRRDRRSMERLREHRHDEWRLEQSRSEQKESDAVRNERRQEGEPS